MLRRVPAPPLRSAALAAALLLAGAAFATAQDPTRDLPWSRVLQPVRDAALAEYYFGRGLERLAGGWSWEAARMFREVVDYDEDKPLGHLGLALAFRDVPNRAARLCWEAVRRRDNGTELEQMIVTAYQDYFGVTRQPELVDERFTKQPGPERARALIAELERIDEPGGLQERFLAVERQRLEPRELDGDLGEIMRRHNAYLSMTGAMPFQVPGYRDLLSRLDGASEQVARLPRHPDLEGPAAPVAPLPSGSKLLGPDAWEPHLARPFELPRGLGGRVRSADYAGKPVLVVFFLGFG